MLSEVDRFAAWSIGIRCNLFILIVKETINKLKHLMTVLASIEDVQDDFFGHEKELSKRGNQ